MELHALLLSILLLSILTGSESRSLDQFSCAKECDVRSGVVFSSNYEYTYLYSANIESSFHTESANDQKALLAIQANIKIRARSPCDLILTVEDIVSIDGSSPRGRRERAWERAITANALLFSFQDGKVDSLCPTEEEPIWALNFKRGILSALQVSSLTSAAAVKELDVSGDCEANYVVESGAYSTEITKIKDYSKCENRDRHLLFSYFTPYEIQSPRQNFIHSSQNCRQTLRVDTIQSVVCTEEHVFRPFSTEQSGARTKISQKLTLTNRRYTNSLSIQSSGTPRRTTLEFEEEQEQAMMNSARERESAVELMNAVCSSMSLENYDIVGKQFIELSYSLRRLDTASLEALYSHLDTCPKYGSSLKEMFVDALPFCGTESCVEFASDLILRDEVKRSVAERWLYGFSFIKNPTSKMVASLMEIVEAQKLPENSFLAVGTLIHRVCSGQSNCLNDNSIRTSLEVLEQHLGANCHTSKSESYRMVLLALRSLGNAGRTTSLRTITRCINEEDNDMEIRVAAIQTFRRMPCSEDRSVLMDTLFNAKADSELRINSYIELMHCPTADLIVKVKDLLETEQSLQVASFMWTHLTETMESDDPLKSFIQVLLTGQTFKKYDLDPRKYSRHHEVSIFSKKLNAGLISEANLIWSPKSFVPRSASVNLTVEVFGQAVNLLEFGGRVQGVEKYIQSYLEPEAFAKRESREPMIRETLSPKVRGVQRRFEEKVPKRDEAKASWFFRVMGNEMYYRNSDMMTEDAREIHTSRMASFAAAFMSEDGFNYHDDSLLMNSIHTLPTGIGMPLQVAFNGSTTVDVHASGRINFQAMMSNSPEFVVQGNVLPRAAVLIMGSMTIDARVKKTGIATESKMVAHSVVDGKARVFNDGNSFEFSLDSPHSKSINFEFKHKLLTVDDDDLADLATTERYPRTNEVDSCSNEFLGQRFCHNRHYVSDRYSNGAPTNPIFPIDGPFEMSAYIEKTDPTITKYTLEGSKKAIYSKEGDSIPSELVMNVDFDTPGSSVNRRTGINLSYDKPRKFFFVRALQSGRTYSVQGSYKTSEVSSSATVTANWNGRSYNFEGMYERTKLDGETSYVSSVEVTLPDKTMTADGKLTVSPGTKLQAELMVKNLLVQPIVMKLDLEDKSGKSRNKLIYHGSGEMSVLPWVNTGFSFDMNLKPKMNNLVLDAQYKIGGRPMESIMLHHKRSSLGSDSETDWNIDHSLRLSEFPSVNHDIKVSYIQSTTVTKTDITLAYGERIDEKRNPYKLLFNQEFNNLSAGKTIEFNGSGSLKVPYLDIDRETKLEHKYSAEEFLVKLTTVKANEASVYNLFVKENNPGSDMLDRTVEVELPTPLGRMMYSNTITESTAKVYESSAELSLGEASENRFSSKATLKNLDNEKSIIMSVERGDGARVLDMSSINKIGDNSVYSSENKIHMLGYQPRGVNIVHHHIASEGYLTKAEYLESDVVQVGAQFTFNKEDTERFFTLTLEENQVQQTVVKVKSGYNFPDENNFEVYFNIDRDSVQILKSRIDYERDTRKVSAGSLTVGFMEKISEKNSDTETTVTWDVDQTFSTSLRHRNQDRNVDFTLVRHEDTISGTLQHNFCSYMNDVSYTIARAEKKLTASLTAGRRRATFIAQQGENIFQLRFDHNVRDLNRLDVPTRASVTMSHSKATDSRKEISFFAQVEDKTYSWVSSFENVASNSDIFNVILQNKVTNTLFDGVPESSDSSLKIVVQQKQASIEITKNSETMALSAVDHLPQKAYIEFAQNLEELRDHAPADISLTYTNTNPGHWSLTYIYDEKSMSVSTRVESDHVIGEWTNSVVSSWPSKLSYDASWSFGERRQQINVDTTYNDETASMNIECTQQYQDAEPLIPLSKQSAIIDISANILRNGKKVAMATDRFELQPDHIGYSFSGMHVFEEVEKYVPMSMEGNANLDLSSSMRRGVMTYAWGSENGNAELLWRDDCSKITIEANAAKIHYTFDYSFDGNSLTIDEKALSGTKVIYTAHLDSNWVYNKDSNPPLSKLNFNINVESDGPIGDYTLNYTSSKNAFEVEDKLTYGTIDFGGRMNGSWKYSDESSPCEMIFNCNMRLNGKTASTANILRYTPATKTLLVSTKNSQTMIDKLPASFNFAKNFTLNFVNMAVELTMIDEDGAKTFVKGNMERDGTNSLSMELHHNIDSWRDTLARDIIIRAERTISENEHGVTLSITQDRVRKECRVSVSYLKAWEETSGNAHLILKANHDFDYLNSELGIPKESRLTFNTEFIQGQKRDANLEVLYSDVSASVKLSMTPEENSIIASLEIPDQPGASAEIKWSGKVGSLSYNIPSLTALPRSLRVEVEPNNELTDLSLNVQMDDSRRMAKIARVMSDATFEFTINHDFDLLSDYNIPGDISVKLALSEPRTFKLVYGEKSILIKRADGRSSMEQNMFANLPKMVELTYEWNLEGQRKIVDISCNVDSKTYSVYLMSDINFQENEVGNFELESKVVMNTVQVGFETSHVATATRKSLDVTLTQTATDELPTKATWNSVFTESENGGSLDITVSKSDEPVTMGVQYTKLRDMHYRATVTHNKMDISEVIPTEFTIEASFTGSKSKGTLDGNIQAGTVIKPFTISFTSEYERELDFSITVNHDFDLLANEFMIPKYTQLTISGTAIDASSTFEYDFDDDRKSVTVHYDYEDSQLHATLDQNIIKQISSSSGRKSGLEFPKKISLVVGKSSEGSYVWKLMGKAGRKRRYFNMEYKAVEGDDSKTFSFNMNQNMNKLLPVLPVTLPTTLTHVVTLGPSSVNVEVVYNSNSYEVGFNREDNVRFCAIHLTAAHSDSEWSMKGVPNQISWSGKRNKEDNSISTILEYDETRTSLEVSGIKAEEERGFHIVFSTTATENPFMFDEVYRFMKEDGEYKFVLTGNQSGLDDYLPKNYNTLIGVKYDEDEKELTLRSDHNIPYLKSKNVPYHTTFAILSALHLKNKNYIGHIIVEADDIFYLKHTINAKLQDKKLLFEGERTKGIWGTSGEDQLNYRGHFSYSDGNNAVSQQYRLTEYYPDRTVYRREVFSNEVEFTEESVTWDLIAQVEMLNTFGVPTEAKGLLTLDNNDWQTTYSATYKGGEKETLTATKRGSNLNYDWRRGDNFVTFRFTTDSAYELDFRHNIPIHYLTYVPRVMHFKCSKDACLLTFDSEALDISASASNKQFRVSLSLAHLGDVFACDGQYQIHPYYSASGNLKISPLELDMSTSAKAHIFEPTTGRSSVEFSLTDNVKKQSLELNGHFIHLNGETYDLDTGLTIVSSLPMIEMNVEFLYTLNEREASQRIYGRVGRYSIDFDTQSRVYKIAATLPATFLLHQVMFTGSCVTQNDVTTSDLSFQWNNKEPVHIVIKSNVQDSAHDISVDISQPLTDLWYHSTYLHYTMSKLNDEYRIRYVERMGGKSLTADVTYTPSTSRGMSTHSLVVDILHNWDHEYIPKHFTTTGLVSYGRYYYDSQWKITSDEIEPVILNKQLKCQDNVCETSLLFKQPFDMFPVRSLSENGRYQYDSNSISMTSDVSYNGKPRRHYELTMTKRYTENPMAYELGINAQEPSEIFGFSSLNGDWTLRQVGEKYRMTLGVVRDGKRLTIDSTYDSPQKNTHHLIVDLRHPFDITNIPQHFITEGTVSYSDTSYNSKWEIKSDEMDPLILIKEYSSSSDNYHMNILFKQPVNDFPLKSLSSTMDLHQSQNAITFTGNWQHNDQPKVQTEYTYTKKSNARNTTLSLTIGEEKYSGDFFFSKKGRNGAVNKMNVAANLYLPEDSTLMGMELPTKSHFNQMVANNNDEINVRTTIDSSAMNYPMNIFTIYSRNKRSQLLDVALEVTRGDDTSEPSVLKTSLTVDLVEGVTVEVKAPEYSVDKSINVKYLKPERQIILTYIADGKHPEVINIYLNEILPRFMTLWKRLFSRDMLPNIEFVKAVRRTDDMLDIYAGLQVKNTPYTLHFIAGVEVKNMYFLVVTKENFVQTEEILRVDANLPTPDNLQLTIRMNKRFSAASKVVMSACKTEVTEAIKVAATMVRDFVVSMKRVVEGSQRVESKINDNVDEWIAVINMVETRMLEIVKTVNENIYHTLLNSDDSMEISVRKAVEILSSIAEQIRSIVNRPLEQLKKDYLESVAKVMFNMMKPMLSPITRLLDQIRAGQLFLELCEEGITKFAYLVDKNFEAIVNAAKRPAAELVVVNDNEVIITIPLSFSVNDLVSLPTLEDVTLWIARSSLAHEVDEKLQILYKLTEYYFQYKSVLNMPLEEILPPFKGHAEVTGFQHFHTFDGKRYDYSSNCESTHVLAHDFRDNEFTVMLTYGRNPYITVTSTDSKGRRNSVILNQDYIVADEDGSEIPLPVEYGDMTVTRTGDVITAKTALGLVVTCNFKTELCTIDVSPFYFAGIAGMAGTFNYEPYDDTEGDNSEDLARSWMTPGDCQATNAFSECSKTTTRVCSTLFTDPKSILHSCFPVINPEKHMQMCVQDTCRRSSEDRTCGAVAAYVRECRLRGVDLPMPETCVQCDSARGGSFSSNQEVAVSAADIVFVIEKSGCLRIKKRDYKRLLNNLHSDLNGTIASGNLKYAVIGFGGPRDLAHPHTITLKNDIFMQAERDLSQSSERQIINSLKRGEKTSEESDVLEALLYAAQLPFRAGASRTIILLTCGDCTTESSVKANTLRALLREQGIVIHHLKQKNIQSGGNSKKVYGFNQENVFAKSSSAVIPRSSLKISRRDQCVPLVDFTSGSVWSAGMLNRESVDYIVNEITTGVNSVPRQSCTCELNINNSPTAKCSAA